MFLSDLCGFFSQLSDQLTTARAAAKTLGLEIEGLRSSCVCDCDSAPGWYRYELNVKSLQANRRLVIMCFVNRTNCERHSLHLDALAAGSPPPVISQQDIASSARTAPSCSHLLHLSRLSRGVACLDPPHLTPAPARRHARLWPPRTRQQAHPTSRAQSTVGSRLGVPAA